MHYSYSLLLLFAFLLFIPYPVASLDEEALDGANAKFVLTLCQRLTFAI